LNALLQPSSPDRHTPQGIHGHTTPKRTSLWKRLLLWSAGLACVLLVLLVAGAYLLLHNTRVHAYLLRAAQEKASQALGSDVQVRDYAFHWYGFGPSLELYGVVVYGAPPYSNPPLLQTDLLRVQVTISSFWHRSWYVNDVLVEHPVVRVLADKHGQTNLPRPSSSTPSSGSSFNIFDLGIRHLALTQGEISYQDHKSDLNADLHDLAVQIGFAPDVKKYSGTLTYHDGRVQWSGANPVVHSLDARFSATPSEFKLEDAELRTHSSRLSLQATAENYAQPKVQAHYDVLLDTNEFRRVLKEESLPRGIAYLTGTLDYQDLPGTAPLKTTTVRGELHSAEFIVTTSTASLPVRNVAAKYVLQNGDASATGIRADVLGGVLAAQLAIQDVAGAGKSHLSAAVKNLSLAAAQTFLPRSATERASLTGSVDANVDANWMKALDNLVAHADVTIGGNVSDAQGGSAAPVNGVVHAAYNATRQMLQFERSDLNIAHTSVSLDGTMSKNSNLQVRVESNELHELEELATMFQSSGASPLGVYGQAKLTATINGSISNPQLHGQLTGTNLKVRDTSWKLLRTQLAITPSSVAFNQGELDPANQGTISFQVAAALRQWAFNNSSSFQVRLKAADLDAGSLAKMTGASQKLSGVISADIEAHGTQMAPVGQGKIELSRAVIANEPVKAANVTFQADGTTAHAHAQLILVAGSAATDLQYQPKQQAYEVSLQAEGIKLDQLETVKAKALGLSGTLSIHANGRGTLQDPGLHAVIEIPKLAIRDQSINNLKATADVASRLAKFDLASDLLSTHASGHGNIQLTGDYSTDVSIDTQAIPLQPLFAVFAPEQAADLNGQTELHASLKGPLKDAKRVEAHVVIPQLKVNYKNSIELAASAPIQADYANGVVDVKRSEIRGTGTDLTFQAHVPTEKKSPVSLLLQGTIDLQLATLFDPGLTAGGQLRFDINSYGQRSDPNVQGQVRIVNASFSEAGTPVGLQNGNGMLTLTRDRLNVTEFKGQVGGGTVTAGGGVTYRPNLRFDLAMKTEGVRVLYQQSIRANLDTNLSLSGTYENAMLRGQVSVEQLSFTSSFDLVNFASQFGDDITIPSTGGFTDNLRLQISVQTPSGLNLSSRQLSLAGSADLQVRGTASQPVMLGRINVSNGDLIFYGNRYVVQAGTIDFRNPSRTEPVLNISANTTIQQYDIQMHLWGPADKLNTNYTSDPSLPPSDIINLIAFGKTAEASAANPTPGTLGAQSAIASQVSSQITNRISEVAGISQLSIDPELGSNQQGGQGTQITIQQRVTGKIFVTFSADVTGTQQEVIQVEYQLNPKASIKALRDQNGGFSFETNFKKEW
jgi:translocation and assembly module TamB